MTSHERRILSYLDQRGPTDRRAIVVDLAGDETKTARKRQVLRRAAPLIMGSWCRRLVKEGMVRVIIRGGHYQCHRITEKGRAALRSGE